MEECDLKKSKCKDCTNCKYEYFCDWNTADQDLICEDWDSEKIESE